MHLHSHSRLPHTNIAYTSTHMQQRRTVTLLTAAAASSSSSNICARVRVCECVCECGNQNQPFGIFIHPVGRAMATPMEKCTPTSKQHLHHRNVLLLLTMPFSMNSPACQYVYVWTRAIACIGVQENAASGTIHEHNYLSLSLSLSNTHTHMIQHQSTTHTHTDFTCKAFAGTTGTGTLPSNKQTYLLKGVVLCGQYSFNR